MTQGRIPSLDGLRALAALMVVFAHCWGVLDLGSLGVEIFFVLSGFLIGGILLDSRRERGWLARFYLRRTARIWPLYFAVVAVIVVTDAWVKVPSHEPHWMLATFLGNIALEFRRTHEPVRTAAGCLWTLAVEEHFYLLLPPILMVTRRRNVPGTLVAIMVASVALRVYLGALCGLGRTAYTLTLTRMDGLCLGVLTAWILRERPSWCRWAPGIAGLSCLAVSACYCRANPWASPTLMSSALWQQMGSVAAASLILSLATRKMDGIDRGLSWQPLRDLGIISYGIYLLHALVQEAVQATTGMPRGPIQFALVLPLVTGLAGLSWRYFERPILSLTAQKPPGATPAPDRSPKTLTTGGGECLPGRAGCAISESA